MTARVQSALLLLGLTVGACSEGSRLLVEIAHPPGFNLASYEGTLQLSIVDEQQRLWSPQKSLPTDALGRASQRLFDGLGLEEGRRYRVRIAVEGLGGLCPPDGRAVGVSPLFEHGESDSKIVVYVGCADGSSAAATLLASRLYHTATFVADPAPHGRVVIAGGVQLKELTELANLAQATIHDSIEVYDPASDATELLPAVMSSPRVGHAAVAVGDDVLITGGLVGAEFAGSRTLIALNAVERLRDRKLDVLTSMAAARGLHLALPLSPERVLLAGGLAQNDLKQLAKAEVYDPSVPTGQVAYGDVTIKNIHWRPPAVGVAFDNQALIVGGLWLTDVEVPSSLFCMSGRCKGECDGPCFVQSRGLPPVKGRNEHLAGAHVPCADGPGAFYLVGGRTDPTPQVEMDDILFDDIYCIDLGNLAAGFGLVGRLSGPRADHTVSVVRGPAGSTRLFVAGGTGTGGTQLANAELVPVDCRCGPSSSGGRSVVQLEGARGGHLATVLADGSVLLTGGIGLNAQITERFVPDF